MVTIPFTGRKTIDPQKLANRLLLKQYGMSKRERGEMFIWKAAMSAVAVPIGSAVYWLLTQVHYLLQYPEPNGKMGSLVNVWFKDTWDRAPVHIDNLLHVTWFGPANMVQASPAWVNDRHDYRHILIGFIATLLIGAFAVVGVKVKKRASTKYMIASVPAAFITAIVISTGLIFLLDKFIPVLANYGAGSGVPFLSDLTGTGAWEPTLIGIIAGVFAHLILKPTFATFQLMSLERNIAQGDKITEGLRKYIYPPNYKARYRVLIHRGDPGKLGKKWIGYVLLLMGVILPGLLAIGIFINYFGPAVLAN